MNTIAIADSRARARFPKRFRSARMHFEFESGPEKMTPDEFWDFCTENDLRAELTKGGEVIIVPPTGFESGDINSELNFQLRGWAKQDKTGNVADSNAGFLLPNGAVYSPDASWTLSTRVNEFSEEKRRKFLPLCPDFVLELRSPSDTLSELTDKMNEYLENGARLGWLIDPQTKQFHVYRPNREPEILQNPVRVSGEDVLVGFELDLNEIWQSEPTNDLDLRLTESGELTHSYSVESDGEVKMTTHEIIETIERAGFDPVERDTGYNRVDTAKAG